MNRIYRLIWSDRLNAYIPVAEFVHGHGKSNGRGATVDGRASRRRLAATLAALAALAGSVQAQPAVTIMQDELAGVSFGSVSSFDNPGFEVLNEGIAVEVSDSVGISGSMADTFVNSGEIESLDSHGVHIGGRMSGNFVNNDAGGHILANDLAVNLPSGLDGDFTNAGWINSGDSYGVYVSGGMTGDLLNTATGRIKSADLAVGITGGLSGSLTNAGDIYAADCHGVLVSGGMTGDFINEGSGRLITSELAFRQQDFVGSAGFSGSVSNAGEVFAGDCHAFWIQGSLTGDFFNAAGGRVFANDVALAVSGGVIGNITNAGDVVAGDCHSVVVSGGLTGDFVNAASGRMWANDMILQLRSGGLSGNITNHGQMFGGDSHGVVVSGALIGDFINSVTGNLWANEDGLRALGPVTGAIENHREVVAGDHGIAVVDTESVSAVVSGGFTNSVDGVVRAGRRNGVAFDSDFTGNLLNEGLIIGDVDQGAREVDEVTPNPDAPDPLRVSDLPVISFQYIDFLNEYIYFDGANVTVPYFIGRSPRAGALIGGNVDGDFENSGTIIGAQGVYIGGDLNGDYDNSGLVVGGFEGLTTPGDLPAPRIEGNLCFRGIPVVIGGNFAGDFRTTVGQGIQVGTYEHDWQPGDGNVAQESVSCTTSPTAGTGEADLTGRTIAVHVPGDVIEDGFQWTAVDAGSLLTDAVINVVDDSANYDFTAQNIGGMQLVITANWVGAGAGPGTTTLPEVVEARNNHVFAADQASYANPAGSRVLNSCRGAFTGIDNCPSVALDGTDGGEGRAVVFDGNLNGPFENQGELLSSQDYGVVISGALSGDFTNAAGALISARRAAVIVGASSGSAATTSSFFNAGDIFSLDCHGLVVSGDLTGNFVNAASGRLYTSELAVKVDGNWQGAFSNHGEIYSGDCHGVFVSGLVTGNFLNAAGAGILANDAAVMLSGGLSGSLTNHGELLSGDCHGVFVASQMSGDFLNGTTGRVVASEIGVHLSGEVSGSVTNQGQILAGDSHGVFVRGPMTGDFLNAASALLWANENGFQLDSEGLTGNFTNHGEIYAGNSFGAQIRGNLNGNFLNGTTGSILSQRGVGVSGAFSGNFTNDGEFLSGDDHGLFVSGLMTGALTNSATGTMWANDIAIQLLGGLSGSFANAGEITGRTAGLELWEPGLGGSGVTGMMNSGVIKALGSAGQSLNLLNTTGPFVFANSGTLVGDAHIGLNTLNLEGMAARILGDVTNADGTVNVNGFFTMEGDFLVSQTNVNAPNGVLSVREGETRTGTDGTGAYDQTGTFRTNGTTPGGMGRLQVNDATFTGASFDVVTGDDCAGFSVGSVISGVVGANNINAASFGGVADDCAGLDFEAVQDGNEVDLQAVLAAPTNVELTPGDGTIRVEFTGVPGATSYTATCVSSDGGAPGQATGASSPLVVTGLTNGATYTCSVTATDGENTSAPTPGGGPVSPQVQDFPAPAPAVTTWGLGVLLGLLSAIGARGLRRLRRGRDRKLK